MIYENFSKFGKGRRTLFANINCNPTDNMLISNEPDAFWNDAENSEIVSVQTDETVKFTANGKWYVKWFDVKPNTSYFLSFFGRTEPPVWTDLNFGILGEDRLPLENHHTKAENDFYVFREGQDQTLTVKGQDGEWYRRTYMFTTFDTEKIGFFAHGNQGIVYLKKLFLCEANKLTNPEARKECMIFNPSEDTKNCAPKNNFIRNFDCFEKGENYGQFINVNGDKLHYSYNGRGCYYLAWLPLIEDRIYTFVYSDKVNKTGNAIYGFIAENGSGKRRWITNKSANRVHDKETTSDAIAVVKGEKVAFAVYDGGGDIEFTDFKIFLMGNGIEEI